MLTRYYQKNIVKNIKISLKKKKTKSVNMVVHAIKIFLKMKNKELLSIEKIVLEFKELMKTSSFFY